MHEGLFVRCAMMRFNAVFGAVFVICLASERSLRKKIGCLEMMYSAANVGHDASAAAGDFVWRGLRVMAPFK